ncbi:hypothetical protein HJC23_002496 [Cyclotella cryptica]|uniref:sn-1-specific diacylglycerol lipase n=1 Tax=Cyclotella cryptica TaxID=29204 RepID=A0ABD3P8T5_9STRA|eukprot:CCRYP_016668-RA/>CCRYP_016668-RA protein AED:0.23 eAED:0.23 QI:0/-1/0/1/-1/1/1/0/596
MAETKDASGSPVAQDHVHVAKLSSSSFRSVESEHIKSPSPLRDTLTRARSDLWRAHPLFLAFIFEPLRDFVLDPTLALWCVLLPPLLRNSPKTDKCIAKILALLLFLPIKFVYCHIPHQDDSDTSSVLLQSHEAILRMRTTRMPNFRPPSDARSAIQGGISFVVSAMGDIVGVMTNPKKMKKWFDAMGQLKAYLDATGVGGELEEAVMKPMLRGRLLDNLKILNDIQEQQDAERHILAKLEGSAGTDIDTPIREGFRFMRWATAAYGVEMIKSALDINVDAQELQTNKQAIIIHCGIKPEDLRYIYSKDDGDKHILHHFVAIDHKSRSIVLALRGTLSLSGAIIDVQGMAKNFCFCLAHQGMADMADDVWEVAGAHINELFQEEELKEYGFIITGHSLGAGVACLLNIKCHVEELVGNRKVSCYGFAPPPTFYPCCADATGDGKPDPPDLVREAIENCTAYIHDNDAVPFLSITSVRRLAALLDAVDNITEHMWFYDRWKIFHEFSQVPPEIFQAVAEAAKCESKEVDGECRMIIPARVVIWMKKNVLSGEFEAYGCDASAVAKNTVFMSQDMFSDHLPEMYEDALDVLLDKIIAK